MRRYSRADAELHAGGGYAAEAEAKQMASSLGIEERILTQPIRTLSGGQRRRVELARILFSGAETMLLDEPTNHLDADSIVWLRGFLASYRGGLIIISHDNALLESCVNKVLHLDANRAEVDIYNMGWKAYLNQRETDERRRKRERMNAERKASTLMDQANKMRAKATKAQAAQSMMKRAERLMDGVEAERRSDKVAKIKFPSPAPCGKTPAHGRRAVEVLRLARRSSPTSTWRSTGGAASSSSASTAPARPRCSASWPASTSRTPARYARGTVSSSGTTPRSTRPSTRAAPCWRTSARRPRSSPTPRPAACSARSCSAATTRPSRPRCSPVARRPGSRWRSWWSRAPTCCFSTSPPTTSTRPPARRCSSAIRSYEGSIILVTHDEGAVAALEPDRVLILPDGVEDLWTEDYGDLIALA